MHPNREAVIELNTQPRSTAWHAYPALGQNRRRCTISGSSWCTLDGMLSTTCPTRKFLVRTALDAIEKSAIAKQQYDSARAEDADSLALALRITKGAERAAVSVLDDHIRQHG